MVEKDIPNEQYVELAGLVQDWLNFPDAADLLNCDVGHVRRLVDENRLISLKWGERKIRSIPADFINNGEPVPGLYGTATLLLDGGFTVEEAIIWLFTHDETLPGTPIELLREGQRGEVRRRAQALAF